MNELQRFIKSFPREQRGEVRDTLATALGVSESMIRHMANGTRSIAARHVLPLEKAAKVMGKSMPRHRLRPDLYPLETAA
jgi:DNA-binding transcriptional regulator YdaS (Cro superfamily)